MIDVSDTRGNKEVLDTESKTTCSHFEVTLSMCSTGTVSTTEGAREEDSHVDH